MEKDFLFLDFLSSYARKKTANREALGIFLNPFIFLYDLGHISIKIKLFPVRYSFKQLNMAYLEKSKPASNAIGIKISSFQSGLVRFSPYGVNCARRQKRPELFN